MSTSDSRALATSAATSTRGPGGFTIIDQRDGEDVEHVGVFDEVESPRRLSFAVSVPKYSAATSRVAIDIEPHAGG
jgi:hypothetical protein